jgi:PAS domain S-box-containing protein
VLGLGWTEPVGMALAGVPALLNLGLLVFAIRRLPRERITYTFMFFLTMLIAWQGFDFCVRAAVDAEAAATWRALLRVWQFFAIASALHFSLMMAGFDRLVSHPVVLIALYVPCVLFEASYSADLIQEHLIHVPVFGWLADSRELGPVFDGFSTLISIETVAIATVIAWNVWVTRGQGDRHAAARLFALGVSFPLVAGLVTELVFPMFLGWRQVPLTSTFMSTFTVATAVALARYDLFQVNTLAAAQAVLQTISDSLLVVHESERIRYLNPFAHQTLGSREGDPIGALFVDPAAHRAFVAGPMSRALRGERVADSEAVLRDRSGAELRCQISLGPLHTDTVGASVVMVVHDVGPLVRIQEELAKARDAAEAANRAKSRFLATTTHELRTPLNAIIGYSELLAEEAVDDGAQARLADLKRIETSGRMLLALIDDLIDLSRIEEGRLTVQVARFSPTDLLREIAPLGIELGRRNGNEYVYEDPPDARHALGDRQRVRQVLLNLLSNAAKFTERGRIRVWVSHHRDERIRFHVSDTGIGMSPEALGKLFGLFNQVHEKDHAKYGGSGIGLALSRRFCSLMGGDLTVESAVSAGSTFTVDLPAARDEATG